MQENPDHQHENLSAQRWKCQPPKALQMNQRWCPETVVVDRIRRPVRQRKQPKSRRGPVEVGSENVREVVRARSIG